MYWFVSPFTFSFLLSLFVFLSTFRFSSYFLFLLSLFLSPSTFLFHFLLLFRYSSYFLFLLLLFVSPSIVVSFNLSFPLASPLHPFSASLPSLSLWTLRKIWNEKKKLKEENRRGEEVLEREGERWENKKKGLGCREVKEIKEVEKSVKRGARVKWKETAIERETKK